MHFFKGRRKQNKNAKVDEKLSGDKIDKTPVPPNQINQRLWQASRYGKLEEGKVLNMHFFISDVIRNIKISKKISGRIWS